MRRAALLLLAPLVAACGAAGHPAAAPTRHSASPSPSPTEPPYVPPPPPAIVTVHYSVTGSAPGVTVTYTTSSGGIGQYASVKTPIRGLTVDAAIGQFVSLSAQNVTGAGTVTCAIRADGELVDRVTSSGGYAVASCQGTIP